MTFETLERRIKAREATIAVIGLGYVGLPLCIAISRSGFPVLGFDIDPAKAEQLAAGNSYIKHIPSTMIAAMNQSGRFGATADFARLSEADVVVICVPTPLSAHHEPDLSFVVSTTRSIAQHLRRGQLVILESTTYPGTTREVVAPILNMTGLACGADYFLAFSPEREDPGNLNFTTTRIPKVVGADDTHSQALAVAFYACFIDSIVPVSSAATAEATKITENIFRAVNIALVNELKQIYRKMGVDVWEVIDAAKTKPFGFMPFYPGPGLGGHCIPIDPFYLTWKAREYGITTRFIELAGEINSTMPGFVVNELAIALDRHFSKGLNGSRILVIGASYKKNVDDTRESPSLVLMELLESRGAVVDYFDPHVSVIPMTREHAKLADRRSIDFDPAALSSYDAALIATDHDDVDYRQVVASCRLIVDTRNACARNGLVAPHVIPA